MTNPADRHTPRPTLPPAQTYLHDAAPVSSGTRRSQEVTTVVVAVLTMVLLSCCSLGVIQYLGVGDPARVVPHSGPAGPSGARPEVAPTTATSSRRERVGRDVTVEWTQWIGATLGDRASWTTLVTGAHTYVNTYTLVVDTQLADRAEDRAIALTMCRVAAMWLSSNPYEPEVRTGDDVSVQVNSAQSVVLADRRSLAEPCIMRGAR